MIYHLLVPGQGGNETTGHGAVDRDGHLREVSGLEKAQMQAFKGTLTELVEAAQSEDSEGFDAAAAQMRQLADNSLLNSEEFLNSLHVPDDAGEYEQDIRDILARIPDGWGRWLSVGRGWYPLVVETHRKLAKLFPDYEVHQVKEKFASLRYYWAEGMHPYQLVHPRPAAPAKDVDDAEWDRWEQEMQSWENDLELWKQTSEGQAVEAELERRRSLADAVVRGAENQAGHICEVCGRPGHQTERGGWSKALCLHHAEESGYAFSRDYFHVSKSEADKKHQNSADAERVIAKLKGQPDASVFVISLWQEDKKAELGAEFVDTLLDWVAQQRCSQAEEWGVDPACTVDIRSLSEQSQELLSNGLAARGLEDLDQARKREQERIAEIRRTYHEK